MPEESPAPATTDCPPETALVDLVAGELAEPEATRVRRHVETCGRCRILSDGLTALAETKAPPGPPADAATTAESARERPRGEAAARPATSFVGTTLDRKYELLRLLGEGGMGSVFEARHKGTGRHVAVKLINARLHALSEGARRRFQREAKAAGSLESPHIVEVLDSGEDEASGGLYLVMEYLRGGDLQELVDRVGPLAPEVALRVAAQALVGLAKAHEAGVVHRDIKPANIFLARRGDGEVTVKLLDFGLAKITADAQHLGQASGLTSPGGLLGSPLYMSPEQAQSGKDVDHRTDLWSLGSTLYCALAGRAPFSHVESMVKLVVAICGAPPPPLRERAPWARPEVGAVVERALTIDRDARYPDAGAMLDAIRGLLPGGLTLREEMLTKIPPEVRAAGLRSPPARADPGGGAAGALDPMDVGGSAPKPPMDVGGSARAAPRRPAVRLDESTSAARSPLRTRLEMPLVVIVAGVVLSLLDWALRPYFLSLPLRPALAAQVLVIAGVLWAVARVFF